MTRKVAALPAPPADGVPRTAARDVLALLDKQAANPGRLDLVQVSGAVWRNQISPVLHEAIVAAQPQSASETETDRPAPGLDATATRVAGILTVERIRAAVNGVEPVKPGWGYWSGVVYAILDAEYARLRGGE